MTRRLVVPPSVPQRKPASIGRRLRLVAVILAALLYAPASQAQTIEGFGEFVGCSISLALQGDAAAPAMQKLEMAFQSGDMLRMGEALMYQMYPAAIRYCSQEAADLFRESAITQFLGAGASAQMSLQAKTFLSDLARRGQGDSALAGRLWLLLGVDAEARGRISDAFRDIRQALARLRRATPQSSTRRQAESYLVCLQRDVAAGTTLCGADAATHGPYSMTPPISFCRSDPNTMAAAGVLALFGRPYPQTIAAFCKAETRLRELMAANHQAGAPPDTTDQVLDTLLHMAAQVDKMVSSNIVARAQFRDLAAAYAAYAADMAQRSGDAVLADHLQSRAHAIADDTAPLRRQATQQLVDGYKGWVPMDPFGPHLLALRLETRVPREVVDQEAFTVMAAAKFDETSLALRAIAARRMRTKVDLESVTTAEAALHPHEAMLAIRLTPAGTGISLLVRHDGAALFPIALTQAAAAAMVNAYRDHLASPQASGGAFDPTEGLRLFRAIFGPLDAAHALDGVTDLFLVPDRTLESIPIAALVTDVVGWPVFNGDGRVEPVPVRQLDSIRFLRDRFAVTLLPSLEDLAALRHTPPAKPRQPYAGLADPIGPAIGLNPTGSDWPLQRLLATADQVRASRQRFHGQPDAVLVGADANLDNLLDLLAEGPFDIIELATHAVAERLADAPDGVPDPPWLLISPPRGASGLAGSFLTLQEIAGLPIDANLVILSACRTAGLGRTEGEGMLSGMTRAFIRAGARSLIVTYWDAPYPDSTQLLAQVTSEMAADSRVSTARAIADAGRHYEEEVTGFRRLPYFWASLGAVGPRPEASVPTP